MKKTYQSPECQAILLADDDILTESTNAYTEANKDGGANGGFNNGAVIYW